jgi:YYY domain-containing protein
MGIVLIDIAVWWLVLEIIGIAALPIASALCGNLKDNGYSISKPLGLLLLTYISWIISVSVGYSYFSVLLSLGIIGACSLIIYFIRGKPAVDKKYIVYFELLFAAAFVVFAIIRAYSPDIYWTGGEKFMDMTFINSLLRTSQFPPLDPWMSGTVIQYYYFGYLVVANLIKISAILPSAAFNLATASFFALSAITALGIGYNLTGRIKYGLITAFFVTIAGNLVGFLQLLDLLRKGDVVNNILSFNYWTSSRVIPDTINEFPFFSFLQGDVHAHMISITFQLLIIFLLLNIMKSRALNIASIFILGLSIGFLYPLNTWDYPVYLFLAIIVLAFHFFRDSTFPVSKKNVLKPIFAIGAVSVLSYLLYLPYHNSYRLDRTVSIITSGRTSLIFYLVIYGLFLYLIYRFVISKSKKSSLKSMYFVIALILLSILSVLLKFELLILLIPMLILSIVSIIKEQNKDHVFVLILIITGTLISLFCELFYIQDALGTAMPSYFRMNTVFKLYVVNWVLWGVSAGAIVFQFRDSFSRKKTWGIVAVLLILMVSVYPVFTTIGKSGGFRGEPNLDGEAWVKKEHPQEYMAILWFRNITGQPVVLQATGELYSWNTYITAFTGLPTVIGWYWHELDWRYPHRQEIDARWSDVTTMYTSSNLDQVSSLLRKYNVSYIYFGEVEAKRYSSPILFESHPEMFEKVFEYGEVVIYKFNPNR